MRLKIRILFVQNGLGIQFFATFNATSTLIEANGAKPCWRLFYAIMYQQIPLNAGLSFNMSLYIYRVI
jgi:hypothetical protein